MVQKYQVLAPGHPSCRICCRANVPVPVPEYDPNSRIARGPIAEQLCNRWIGARVISYTELPVLVDLLDNASNRFLQKIRWRIVDRQDDAEQWTIHKVIESPPEKPL